jgi:hypothetical protein
MNKIANFVLFFFQLHIINNYFKGFIVYIYISNYIFYVCLKYISCKENWIMVCNNKIFVSVARRSTFSGYELTYLHFVFVIYFWIFQLPIGLTTYSQLQHSDLILPL